MSRPLDRNHVDCLLEVQTPSIPTDVIKLVDEISHDRNASLRERDLAYALLAFARTIERLISNLEHGTISIRAYERDVQIVPPRNSDD